MPYSFQFGEVLRYWPLLLQGAAVTIAYSVVCMTLSMLLGTAAALARRSRSAVPRSIGRGYVDLIRNTPLLVQLFILFFGLPEVGIRMRPELAALFGLVIYNGAFATEIIRAGLQAVPRGQLEAGLSIGMSRLQVFVYVVARPALEKVYPALSSQFILLMLGTSVISAIGVDELTAMAERIQSDTFRSIEVYLVCMLIYLALTLAFRAVARQVGHRLFRYRRIQARTAG